MSLTIRRAERTDAAIIARFNQGIAEETESMRLDSDVLIQGVQAVFEDPTRGFYTVAVRPDGEVVGQAMITYEWSDWRNGWFWWVQSVYVREDARRLGVFRALFDHLKREATLDISVIGLRLYFDHGNTRGHATYRSLGLEDTEYRLMEIYPLPGRTSALEDVKPSPLHENS